MPLALGVEPVFVGGARVQDRVVVQELDVTRHESHVEPQFVVARQRRQHIQRLDVLGRQPPRIGESLGRTDMQS